MMMREKPLIGEGQLRIFASHFAELLPGQPKNVEVQPISPTQLRIDWLAPHQPTAVQNYVINITELTSFDPNLKMMPSVTVETKVSLCKID